MDSTVKFFKKDITLKSVERMWHYRDRNCKPFTGMNNTFCFRTLQGGFNVYINRRMGWYYITDERITYSPEREPTELPV